MIRRIHVLIAVLVITACVLIFRIYSYLNSLNMSVVTQPFPAPEFTQFAQSSWLNSVPLELTDFKGKVVVLFVWAFD